MIDPIRPTPRTDKVLSEIGNPEESDAWGNNVVFFARNLERDYLAARDLVHEAHYIMTAQALTRQEQDDFVARLNNYMGIPNDEHSPKMKVVK